MVDTKKATEIPASDERIAEADAQQVTSNYQTYVLPDANNGQGRAIKARTPQEAKTKADKLDKDIEGSK